MYYENVLKLSEYEVREELERARRKFPSTAKLLHAFTEEAGEVTKAFLNYHEGKGTVEEIRAEIIQAAAMAFRLLEEGDPEFPGYVGIGGEKIS